MDAFQIVASQSRRDYLSVEKRLSNIHACRRPVLSVVEISATIWDAFLMACRYGGNCIFSTERYIPNGTIAIQKNALNTNELNFHFVLWGMI